MAPPRPSAAPRRAPASTPPARPGRPSSSSPDGGRSNARAGTPSPRSPSSPRSARSSSRGPTARERSRRCTRRSTRTPARPPGPRPPHRTLRSFGSSATNCPPGRRRDAHYPQRPADVSTRGGSHVAPSIVPSPRRGREPAPYYDTGVRARGVVLQGRGRPPPLHFCDPGYSRSPSTIQVDSRIRNPLGVGVRITYR